MKALARLAAALAAQAAFVACVHAQAFPSKPIRFIVPSGPGIITDIVARALAQNIASRTGWTVLVDNKPGGNYAVGMQALMAQPADGHTIFMGVSSMTLLPTTNPGMGINWVDDLERVTKLVTLQNALFAGAGAPYKTFQQFSAYAKQNPAKLSFGSIGAGSVTDLAGAQLNQALEVNMHAIPYRDNTLLNDVVAGTTDLGIIPPFNIAPQVHEKKLVPLAVLGSDRSPMLPDVPSTRELGYPDVNADGWLGIVVKKGTPEAVKQALHAEFVKALADPEVRSRLAGMGLILVGDSAAQFDKSFRDDVTRWARLIPKLKPGEGAAR